jgi:hypothetical protein
MTTQAAKPTVTIKKTTKKTFGPADPVTVVAATPDVGHKIPAPTGWDKKKGFHYPALVTETEGRFAFTTAATVPVVIPGWDKIEADTPDTYVGAESAIAYLRGIGADASRALLTKLFPKKLTVKKPRTVTPRVGRAKIDDTQLLRFIYDNGLADARIQAILDSVRAAGCSASQSRVDKLLGRTTAV